jgi:hypothetical protein
MEEIMEMRLSPKDWEVFVKALEKPPEANENLRRLLRGEGPTPMAKHRYETDMTSGIGFCAVCMNDDENDGNHFVEAK